MDLHSITELKNMSESVLSIILDRFSIVVYMGAFLFLFTVIRYVFKVFPLDMGFSSSDDILEGKNFENALQAVPDLNSDSEGNLLAQTDLVSIPENCTKNVKMIVCPHCLAPKPANDTCPYCGIG